MDTTELELSIRNYEAFARKETLSISNIIYKGDADQTTFERCGKLDNRRVKALYNEFEANGCRRQDNPVIIRSLNGQFICLEGRHRLEAGRMFLNEDDQYWPGLIFGTSSAVLLTYLQSSDIVLELYSDGDLYRITSYYQSRGNDSLVDVWKGKLSKGKRRHIKILEGLIVSGDASIADHMKKLLPYPGLWSTLKLGMHRIETMRCQEEVACYLDSIYGFWSEVCGDEPLTATIFTVQKLEGKYPEISAHDAEWLSIAVDNCTIFEKILDTSRRAEILSKCLNNEGRILSLTTFLEDTKMLSLSFDAIKLLLPKALKKNSMKSLLRGCFSGDIQCPDRVDQSFERAYRRLLLFTWQILPEVITSRQLRLRKSCNQPSLQKSPTKVADLESLAMQLGFHNISGSFTASAKRSESYLSQTIELFLKDLSKGRAYQSVHMRAAVQAINDHVEVFLQTTRSTATEPPRLTQQSLLRLLKAMSSMMPLAPLPHMQSKVDAVTELLRQPCCWRAAENTLFAQGGSASIASTRSDCAAARPARPATRMRFFMLVQREGLLRLRMSRSGLLYGIQHIYWEPGQQHHNKYPNGSS